MVQRQHFLQPQKVDIVGGVDGAAHAEDAVGHGLAPPQHAVVLYVVYPKGGKENRIIYTLKKKNQT